jgi:hypothetical protein
MRTVWCPPSYDTVRQAAPSPYERYPYGQQGVAVAGGPNVTVQTTTTYSNAMRPVPRLAGPVRAPHDERVPASPIFLLPKSPFGEEPRLERYAARQQARGDDRNVGAAGSGWGGLRTIELAPMNHFSTPARRRNTREDVSHRLWSASVGVGVEESEGFDPSGDEADGVQYTMEPPPRPEEAMGQLSAMGGRTVFERAEVDDARRVILHLLERRGVDTADPANAGLVSYHMAREFVQELTAVGFGTYLVVFPRGRGGGTHERWFFIRHISARPNIHRPPEPCLAWVKHQSSSNTSERLPLENLVGITTGAEASQQLQSRLDASGCIAGPVVSGKHRLRVKPELTITLWFLDKHSQMPSSLDVAARTQHTHALWVRVLSGICAVNSTTLGGAGSPNVTRVGGNDVAQSQLLNWTQSTLRQYDTEGEPLLSGSQLYL